MASPLPNTEQFQGRARKLECVMNTLAESPTEGALIDETLKYAYYSKAIIGSFLGKGFRKHHESSIEGSHLCRASGHGESGLVKVFVEILGVAVDARDRTGRTALHCGSMHGYGDVVSYLLQRGANCHTQEDSDGMTPLHLAAWSNHVDIAVMLIRHGADVDATNSPGPDKQGLRTPLHLAGERGHVEMCRLLIDRGAKVDRVSAELGRQTALHFACSNGKEHAVALLLTNGANPNALTYRGVTPLLMATDGGHGRVVELLLEHGAKVDVSCDGFTPLTNACRLQYTDIVRCLALHGADVNHARNGCPALVKACCQNQEDVVRCLVELGADLSKPDLCDGETPLITAATYGHKNIVLYLLSKGANPRATSFDGRTALFSAMRNNHTDIVRLLRKH